MRCFLFFALACVFTVQAESPAVTKVLTLFSDLNKAQVEKGKKVSFTLSDSEVNEYLRHARTVNPRPGLDNMHIQFYPNNYIATLTTIDFDAVEKFRPGTVPTLLKPVLNGKRAVQVDVHLIPQAGTTTFTVEKAYFESVRIPAFVVEKMIAALAARQKEKYDTSKPVPLPFGLQTLNTSLGKVSGAN